MRVWWVEGRGSKGSGVMFLLAMDVDDAARPVQAMMRWGWRLMMMEVDA